MYSFIISILALILGYVFYGRLVEKVFGPDPSRITPAVSMADGVDYIPLPGWKVFLIQFLNIAGTGPIFGAIMGAKFGPSCYLWIVFGSIFAGAVHDYFSGMLSMRNRGESLPNVLSMFFGKGMKVVITCFILLLLLLVGAVFVYSPALILGKIAAVFSDRNMSIMFWVLVIFLYYILATLLPIDKIIGKIYPLFAFALLFMAAGLMVCLFIKWPDIPEIWDGLQNRGPEVGLKGQSIFPCLFITVACGAISGFHATQSPLMARCISNEKLGRPIFYGAMIVEGLVALIWAAVSSYFFFDGGMAEVGATSTQAPEVVTSVARAWLGVAGGILAILGVVAAPITSGDTALRSARLIIGDFAHISQKKPLTRVLVSLPIFVLVGILLWFNIADENGFNTIWRYFGWTNQTIACITLWVITIWLHKNAKGLKWLVSFVPAVFLSSVCATYIAIDKIGFHLPADWAVYIASATAITAVALFLGLRKINPFRRPDAGESAEGGA